jgi:hypothetical protein
VDFFSIFEKNYLKIVETEKDQAYWLKRTVKSLFRTPSEATTLKCNLLHFKPMLPFLHEKIYHTFSQDLMVKMKVEKDATGSLRSFWR